MSYITDRIEKFGDAIWYFPGGIAAMIALYLIITYVGRPRPEESAVAPTGSPQAGRLGCVWTLAAVYLVVWIFLILRA